MPLSKASRKAGFSALTLAYLSEASIAAARSLFLAAVSNSSPILLISVATKSDSGIVFVALRIIEAASPSLVPVFTASFAPLVTNPPATVKSGANMSATKPKAPPKYLSPGIPVAAPTSYSSLDAIARSEIPRSNSDGPYFNAPITAILGMSSISVP